MAKAATSTNHEPWSSLRSDRVAALRRNGWPAWRRNEWPASSEYAAGIRVKRDGAKTFFIRYRSPTLKGKDPDKRALRRFYFGEHRSGRPGEGRYFSLKEFETAYAVFRGQLAQGVAPLPLAVRRTGWPAQPRPRRPRS